MLSYSGVAIVVKSLLLALTFTALFGVSPVAAQDGRVEVMVCPTGDASRLTVLQPQGDSVVAESKVAISGEVEFISQIDFFINDTYNHTIALGASDTNFESNVTLPPGTNTLKIAATARCSLPDRVQSIVLTHQPNTPPSVGRDVPTIVDDRVLDSVLLPEQVPEKNPIKDIYDNWVVAPIIIAGESLDIVNTSEEQAEVNFSNASRALGFVAGVTMISMATIIQLGGLSLLTAKFAYLGQHRVLIGVAGFAVLALVFIL